MSYAMIQTPTKTKGGYAASRGSAWYQTPEGCAGVDLSYQRTGYGEKAFLVCPICGKRRERLYISNWRVGCRDHLTNGGLYRGIQYTTKGGADRIEYTMRKIADKHGIVLTIGDAPIDYLIADKRPPFMFKRKFADLIARLDLLDRMRGHAILAAGHLFSRTAAHLENNVPLIGLIERGSTEELAKIRQYQETMTLAQRLYRQDWGFPKEG